MFCQGKVCCPCTYRSGMFVNQKYDGFSIGISDICGKPISTIYSCENYNSLERGGKNHI